MPTACYWLIQLSECTIQNVSALYSQHLTVLLKKYPVMCDRHSQMFVAILSSKIVNCSLYLLRCIECTICCINLRSVHNTTLNNALRCVVFASTLVETQHDARIDSDPILAFSCVAFLRQVVKKPLTFLVINLSVSRTNATQCRASLWTSL